MIIKLSNDVEHAVQHNHGIVEAAGEHSDYVVMSINYFRKMMGIGRDEELRESVEAIEQGLADVDAGRTRPMDQVFRELDEKYGIHD